MTKLEQAILWCQLARAKLGAVDGYDYRSGQEYGLRRAQLELERLRADVKALDEARRRTSIEDMTAEELRHISRTLATYADILTIGDKEVRHMSRRCWEVAALLDAAGDHTKENRRGHR